MPTANERSIRYAAPCLAIVDYRIEAHAVSPSCWARSAVLHLEKPRPGKRMLSTKRNADTVDLTSDSDFESVSLYFIRRST